MTLAATVATAPLIAHDFERLSLASIPANVLVLVAVAPVMWLGMLIAMLGQLPGLPPPFLGSIEGHLLDYVAAVARALGSPSWAQTEVTLPAPAAVIAIYLLSSVAACVLIAWLRRRRGLGLPRRSRIAAAVVVLAALLAIAPLGAGGDDGAPADTLRVVELDVGQGDATLLQPPRGAPVLVDAGPPGGAAAAALADRGIDRLRAVFITHDELDHAGGLREVLATAAVDELVVGRRSARLEAAARAAGARIVPTAEGSSLRFGGMRIDVLWPPREHVEQPIAEANDDSLVLAARFDGYDALLTGDAEAEATHLDPGPFDVLKVAHHGSDDAGLPALLDRSVPRVALIGVGAGNSIRSSDVQHRPRLRQRPPQLPREPPAELLSRTDRGEVLPQLRLQRRQEALVTLPEAVGRLGLRLGLLVGPPAPGNLLLALDNLLLKRRLLPRAHQCGISRPANRVDLRHSTILRECDHYPQFFGLYAATRPDRPSQHSPEVVASDRPDATTSPKEWPTDRPRPPLPEVVASGPAESCGDDWKRRVRACRWISWSCCRPAGGTR